MKKFLFKIFLIVFLVMCLFSENVYATKLTNLNYSFKIYGLYESNIKDYLKNNLGCRYSEGNTVYLYTYFKGEKETKKDSRDGYDIERDTGNVIISVGKANEIHQAISGREVNLPEEQKFIVSEEEAKKLGYEDGKKVWSVQLVAEINEGGQIQGELTTVTITIKEIYYGEDTINIPDDKTNNAEEINLPRAEQTEQRHEDFAEDVESIKEEIDAFIARIEEIIDELDFLNKIKEFFKEFANNVVAKIITMILDGFKIIIGDTIQNIANMIQTEVDGTLKNFKITYSYEQLSSEGNEGANNQYTRVSKNNGTTYSKQKTKTIEGTILDEDAGFSEETKIPVIIAEPYYIATNQINFLDINILKVDKVRHRESTVTGKGWMVIRTIGVTVMRIAIFLSATAMLTIMIWNGIALVKGSFSPNERLKNKKSLIGSAKGIGILVGTVFIMAICIYATNATIKALDIEKNKQGPIRAIVKDAEGEVVYSFSTTGTGLCRYMCDISNIKLYKEKAKYVLIYIAMAICNLVLTLSMMFRVVALIITTVIGSALALFYTAGEEEKAPIKFNQLMGFYIAITGIEVAMAGIFKLIMTVAII